MFLVRLNYEKQLRERERESVAILAKGAYSDIEDDPLHICSKGGLGRGEGPYCAFGPPALPRSFSR